MVCQVYGNKITKLVYAHIAEDVMVLHSKYIKWKEDLGEDITECLYDFGTEHARIYKTTNMVKYRSFQYRLMQRALVTNIHLSKWKITTTDRCSFCHEEKETILHMLIFCPRVQELWERVFQYIRDRFRIQHLNTGARDIVLNRLVPGANSAVNMICLMTKQFLYRQRCLNKPIEYNIWKPLINQVESIEKYIAVKNGKLSIHNRKWSI